MSESRMDVARLSGAPLSEVLFECIAILAVVPILLSVALWNNYPIIFYDTGAYILQGLGHVFIAERSPVYSLFLRYASNGQSLWLVVLVQSVISSFVLVQAVRAEMPKASLWLMLGIAALLCVVTGLPWYAGQVEPDCMTALVALSLYLLAFRAERLGAARSTLLVAVAALATAMHPSHLGLAGGLAIVIVLTRIAVAFWRVSNRPVVPRVLLPVLAVALGIFTVVAANYALTQKIFISRSGGVFLSARMMQDGIVKRLLDDTCPGSGYRLCAYKDQLPPRADAWLWERISPFNHLGGFVGTEKESERVVSESLRRYPWMNLQAAAKDTALQFFLMQTGDGIDPQEWVLDNEFRHFLPRQLSGYLDARQQRGELRFLALNVLHVGVALLSLFGLGFMLWRGIAARRWDSVALPAFVLVALLGNAMICGVLSGPHGRYQSRIAWLPVFTVALAGAARLGQRARALPTLDAGAPVAAAA